MKYTQNNEEDYILNYFKDNKGTVLDIGANDGVNLSNSRKVIELGWNAELVEPAEIPFAKLQELYKDNPNIHLHNYGIANKSGLVTFYNSNEHLGKGDSDLLSTAVESELKRWEGSNNTFTKSEIIVKTFEEFYNNATNKTFDLISIDVEGLDYEVLTQIDLNKVECKMLIVETNSKEDQKYIDYVSQFGLKLIHKNFENLIFTK